jgi:hypothetical protein
MRQLNRHQAIVDDAATVSQSQRTLSADTPGRGKRQTAMTWAATAGDCEQALGSRLIRAGRRAQ